LSEPARSDTSKSFRFALNVQFRVLGALFLWEVIQRFGRDNLGFIWLFLEPMIFTLAITILWTAMDLTHNSSLPIVAFALTGYSTILLWRNCANRCSRAIEAYMGLLYHKPIRVLDVLLTKIFLEVAGATSSFIVLGIFWVSIGWAAPPEDMLVLAGGWLLLIWFATGLALVIGALTSISEIWERLWHPTAYILFPLSGAGYMVDWLSPTFQAYILWLPMVHCTEVIRAGYFGPSIPTHYDVQYVVVANLIMTVLGLALVHSAARRIEFR
jgi:capsular polysaccharide transport system permease protein